MKHIHLLCFTVALLGAVTCGKSSDPDNSGPEAPAKTTFTFDAQLVSDVPPASAPAAKATVGALDGSNKRRMLWEDGDKITVFSKADFDPDNVDGTKNMAGYLFQTSLEGPSSSATFSSDAAFPVSDEYIAVYPPIEGTKTVNFSSHQMVQFTIPHEQMLPEEGGFDKKAAVAVACAPGRNSLAFKNTTALIRFRVSDSDIVAGWIETGEVPADKETNNIAGGYRINLDFDNNEADLDQYGSSPYYNRIDFTIDGSTPFRTGTDYYIVVRPATLTEGFRLYLNGYLVESFTNAKCGAFEKKKIYNVGTLTKAGATEILLNFPFHDATVADALLNYETNVWPGSSQSYTSGTSADDAKVNGDPWTCSYTLFGTPYYFISASCTNTSSFNRPYINSSASNSGPNMPFPYRRYLALPKVSGYTLSTVTITVNKSQNANWMPMIGTALGNSTILPDAATGGSTQTVTFANNTSCSFNLTGQEDQTGGTYYWIGNGGLGSQYAFWISNLQLTYTKVN